MPTPPQPHPEEHPVIPAVPEREHTFVSGGMPTVLWTTFWCFAAFYGPQPLLPAVRDAFAVDQSTAGLMITLTILPLGLAPIVYGTFLGAVSAKRLLTAAVALLALLLIPPAAAASFGVILAARFVQGLLLPAILLALMTHVSSHYSGPALQRNLGFYAATTMLGAFAGRVYSGLMGSLFGWRGAFAALALATASSLIPLLLLRDAGRPRFTVLRLRVIPSLARQRGLWVLLCLAPAAIFIHASMLNFIPFRMRQLRPDISDFGISLMYLAAFFSALLCLNAAAICRWCGSERRVLLYGAGLVLAALPCMLLPDVGVAFATLLAMSIGYALIYTTLPGLVNRLTRRDKALTNGVYLACYYAGSASGTYFPGLVYSAAGWNAFIWTLWGMALILTGLALKAQGLALRR